MIARIRISDVNFTVVLISKVMLGEALDISRETYLAILMDREFQGPVIVASPEGGVDIEEVAEKTPDKIYKVRFFYFQQRLQIQLYNSD